MRSPDEGATLQYRYDKNHNLIAAVTPTGKATYYSYSDEDRIVAINLINAVINSNFEVDADGDAAPDHFTFNDGIPGLPFAKERQKSA
ncbi:RHS repeat protein [Tumebacillus sp. DT12]|uniref:RHS repeat protein n=1 Tax=Tumebacillus lacus TaxID=2995335 RepID=A0ABT3X0S1_9BACL|nr:RHS repeat domain-containing protein [Tumebacillus lacus]MCX7570493.1 RHS repeat protein [Tumebacillus lacus]